MVLRREIGIKLLAFLALANFGARVRNVALKLVRGIGFILTLPPIHECLDLKRTTLLARIPK